jgi:hypothetical protein
MSILSAANILESNDLAFKDVDVPEWKGTVRLQQLSAFDTIEMMEEIEKDKTLGIYLILIWCAVDETGARLFPFPAAGEPRQAALEAHIEKLKVKNMSVLDLLQRAALKVNAVGVGVDLKKA